MRALIVFQVSIQLAGRILYAVAFINYYVVPMYFAQLWSIMLVHQIFIRGQKNVKFLVNNPFPEKQKELIRNMHHGKSLKQKKELMSLSPIT